MIPGWPYSFVAALGPGATSWTTPLDAVRLGPDDDDTEVTAAQLREVTGRLAAAGAWREGDPDIIVVLDAGYDVTRLAWLLADLPLVLCARLRSNRAVLRGAGAEAARHRAARPASTAPRSSAIRRRPGRPRDHRRGRHQPVRHRAGRGVGPGCTPSWPRLGGWEHHPGKIPLIEGTLIQLRPARLPGCRELKPMWLWASVTGASEPEITVLWQAFLRRFDLEHTFRLFKQVLGWDAPLLRDPAAADRWTWLIIACYAQLRLARPLAADLRLPWQRPQPPGTMTPARVRRGFRCVRDTVGTPAAPPKPCHPGPGRPKGSTNQHKAPRYDVGKRHPKGRTTDKTPR